MPINLHSVSESELTEYLLDSTSPPRRETARALAHKIVSARANNFRDFHSELFENSSLFRRVRDLFVQSGSYLTFYTPSFKMEIPKSPPPLKSDDQGSPRGAMLCSPKGSKQGSPPGSKPGSPAGSVNGSPRTRVSDAEHKSPKGSLPSSPQGSLKDLPGSRVSGVYKTPPKGANYKSPPVTRSGSPRTRVSEVATSSPKDVTYGCPSLPGSLDGFLDDFGESPPTGNDRSEARQLPQYTDMMRRFTASSFGRDIHDKAQGIMNELDFMDSDTASLRLDLQTLKNTISSFETELGLVRTSIQSLMHTIPKLGDGIRMVYASTKKNGLAIQKAINLSTQNEFVIDQTITNLHELREANEGLGSVVTQMQADRNCPNEDRVNRLCVAVDKLTISVDQLLQTRLEQIADIAEIKRVQLKLHDSQSEVVKKLTVLDSRVRTSADLANRVAQLESDRMAFQDVANRVADLEKMAYSNKVELERGVTKELRFSEQDDASQLLGTSNPSHSKKLSHPETPDSERWRLGELTPGYRDFLLGGERVSEPNMREHRHATYHIDPPSYRNGEQSQYNHGRGGRHTEVIVPADTPAIEHTVNNPQNPLREVGNPRLHSHSTPNTTSSSQGGHTSQFNRPRAKLPSYDGTGNWKPFLAIFESLANQYGLNDVTQASMLGECLKGPAAEYFAYLPVRIRTSYASLVEKLEDMYGIQNSPGHFQIKLSTIQQKEGESLVDFAMKTYQLACEGYPTEPKSAETAAAQHFLRGCSEKKAARWALEKDPSNVQDALRDIRKWLDRNDIIFGHKRKVTPKPKPTSSPAVRTVSAGSSVDYSTDSSNEDSGVTVRAVSPAKTRNLRPDNKSRDSRSVNKTGPRPKPVEPPDTDKGERLWKQLDQMMSVLKVIGGKLEQSSAAKSGTPGGSRESRPTSSSGASNRSRSPNMLCYRCGSADHLIRECRSKSPSSPNRHVSFQGKGSPSKSNSPNRSSSPSK